VYNRPIPVPLRGPRGFSLLEALVAMALSSLTALLGVAAARETLRGLQLEDGRRLLLQTLLDARRLAYLEDQRIAVAAEIGGRELRVTVAAGGTASERTIGLPAGLQITGAPADGDVVFHRGALAENATFAVGRANGDDVRVVVNQRGRIR
jgi:prepilin-type N-terminal cleavage/methylation domain-containing protein